MNSQRPDARPKHPPRRLLVIGDWLLDENWITGEHRGAISSRTGSEHLRALHHRDNPLYRLAGAGQTASTLYCALKDRTARAYQIFGVGIWDPKDTDAIKVLLDVNHEAEARPSQYRITRSFPVASCKANLFNLGDIVDAKKKCADKTYRSGTMRAVRIYQYKDSRLKLKERIDWAPRIFDDHTSWIGIGEQAVLNTSDLKDAGLDNLVRDATAIVVQDTGKGVMSSPFVKWLAKLAPAAQWFISTKAWRPVHDPAVPEEQPDWLHELERAEANVRLLVIPEAAAQRAVDEGVLSRWIVNTKDKGGPSSKALKRIDELARQFDKAAIVVLPAGFALLARDPGTDPPGTSQCIVQSDTGIEDPLAVGSAISSVLFPAITAHMLQHKSLDLEKTLNLALGSTRRCWEEEVKRIKESEKQPESSELPRILGDKKTENRFGSWSRDSWLKISQEWDQALKECGIIDDKPPRIELWRAMIDIDGFVCCVPTKRHAIGRIRRELDLFKREARPVRRAVSFLVVAPPGSGKTHFVKRLAESCALSLVQFNITQLNDKDDILDCFDAIVTRQAQDDRPLLVFFDEINARINNQHIYDSFLAPIEDGVYVRGGKTFRMPACAWLFAGTENPEEHPDKSTKGSDFVSRLSLPPIDVKLEAGEEADLNTERVYLGVSLLKRTFSDVREVSEKVLRAFEFMRPDVDVRRIRHFVNSFSDVQHEKALSRNISLEQLKSLTHLHTSHRHHFDKWKELEEGVLVVIESEGPVKVSRYPGLSEMKKTFPEVKQAREKVLRAFEFIRPDVDVLQIRHFVESFSGVQHEKVVSSNIPVEELKRLTHPDTSHQHHIDKWKALKEGKFILIKKAA